MKDIFGIPTENLIGVLGILIGGFLAWLIAGLNTWWKIRRDNRRILRQVLFDLLKTYQIVIRGDFKETSEYIRGKLKEKADARNVQYGQEMDEAFSDMIDWLKVSHRASTYCL